MLASENLLQEAIIQEIVSYLGLAKPAWRHWLARRLLMIPAGKCVKIAAGFDRQVGATGFCEASRWLLPQILEGYWVAGKENIPRTCPLIIAANHPGTFDTFLIAACLPRNDIKIAAHLQVAIFSGFVTPRYLRHPLARMQKDAHWSQILAEILQISSQVAFRKKHELIPEITFGELYSLNQLTKSNSTPLAGAIEVGRKCLFFHQQALLTHLKTQNDWRSKLQLSVDYGRKFCHQFIAIGNHVMNIAIRIDQCLRHYAHNLLLCPDLVFIGMQLRFPSPQYCSRDFPGWYSQLSQRYLLEPVDRIGWGTADLHSRQPGQRGAADSGLANG